MSSRFREIFLREQLPHDRAAGLSNPCLVDLAEPFTAHGIDLAGALISPTLALIGGWFLWWWSRRMKFRYRWVLLILCAIRPILVHGTELGRPDHQSLSMLLVTIAICAEWSSRFEPAPGWSAVSGIMWGLAIWVSAYESLVLFLIVMAVSLLEDRKALFAKSRRAGWICFALIIAIALLIEQRTPSMSFLQPTETFKNWARTIGELAHVSPVNPVWFRWAGYMIAVTPLLIWVGFRRIKSEGMGKAKARRLQLLFCLSLPISSPSGRALGIFLYVDLCARASEFARADQNARSGLIAFGLSVFPILRDWDVRLWPNEAESARRIEQRNESLQLRDLAIDLQSSELRPFLAPWWLSPSIAYWSGQPAAAGSSHESLSGIEDSARFFLADDWRKAREILENRKVTWVIAYDFERVAQNSSDILGLAVPRRALCSVLDRTPARASQFLIFSAQNGIGKLYRVAAEP